MYFGARNGEKLNMFNVFVKIAQICADYKWEVLTFCKIRWSFYKLFWKSSSPSTVPVHRGSPGNFSNFPGSGPGSLTILKLEPYMLDAYLGNINIWRTALFPIA